MPQTKTVEAAKEPEICILKMGKNNNVILWKESMYNMATELFGEVGTYFYTNVAYRTLSHTKGNTIRLLLNPH